MYVCMCMYVYVCRFLNVALFVHFMLGRRGGSVESGHRESGRDAERRGEARQRRGNARRIIVCVIK